MIYGLEDIQKLWGSYMDDVGQIHSSTRLQLTVL